MNRSILFLSTFFILNNTAMSQDFDMAPVKGAKMYFSDKPFAGSNETGKTNFTSGDFIYGRIEFDNQTLQEALKLPKDGQSTMNNKNDCFLRYALGVYKGDKRILYWGNESHFIYVTTDKKKGGFINFDIAPDSRMSSSYISQTDDFNHGYFYPFYQRLISPNYFAEDGEYTILVLLYNQSQNAWGQQDAPEKWPVVAGEFSYNFQSKDITSLQDNGKLAGEKINTVRVDKLPDCFTHPVKISDPTVTIAKVTPLIKNYLNDYQVLKIAIEPASSMWSIVKNDFGLLSYRYVTGYYRIVYKKDGKCTLGSVRVFQDYIGGGKYGNLYCKFWGDEGDIDCSLVK